MDGLVGTISGEVAIRVAIRLDELDLSLVLVAVVVGHLDAELGELLKARPRVDEDAAVVLGRGLRLVVYGHEVPWAKGLVPFALGRAVGLHFLEARIDFAHA